MKECKSINVLGDLSNVVFIDVNSDWDYEYVDVEDIFENCEELEEYTNELRKKMDL